MKFTRRDERDRAGREYDALRALGELGLALAPAPVLLEQERYELPVVVQMWLAGDVRAAPPESEAEWRALLEHLAAVHSVRPATVRSPLRDVHLTFTTAEACWQQVLRGAALVPESARTAELNALARRVEAVRLPEWPEPELTLCLMDPNTTNFIRRPGAWVSVDWENSGWGDPAFELADLLAHPAYLGLSEDERERAIDAYCALSDDRLVGLRARAYLPLMLADWAMFFARKAYEHGQGRPSKARLVNWPAEWYAGLPQRAVAYTQAALTLLSA